MRPITCHTFDLDAPRFSRCSWLDGKHCVFGFVRKGHDVIAKIARMGAFLLHRSLFLFLFLFSLSPSFSTLELFFLYVILTLARTLSVFLLFFFFLCSFRYCARSYLVYLFSSPSLIHWYHSDTHTYTYTTHTTLPFQHPPLPHAGDDSGVPTHLVIVSDCDVIPPDWDLSTAPSDAVVV